MASAPFAVIWRNSEGYVVHNCIRLEMSADRVDRRMVEQQRRRHLGRVLLSDHARELGRRERIEPRVHQRRVRPQLLAHELACRGQHVLCRRSTGFVALALARLYAH